MWFGFNFFFAELRPSYKSSITEILLRSYEIHLKSVVFGLVDHLTFSPVSAEGRLYHVISKFWKLIPLISDFSFCFVEMIQNGGRVKKFFEINVCSEMYIRVVLNYFILSNNFCLKTDNTFFLWLQLLISFHRDIGIEAIQRAGFAKFVDVRHLDGYPDSDRPEFS